MKILSCDFVKYELFKLLTVTTVILAIVFLYAACGTVTEVAENGVVPDAPSDPVVDDPPGPVVDDPPDPVVDDPPDPVVTDETYWVDGASSGCSNVPGNGSEESPWCTVTYALSQIGPGDDIYIKGHTYTDIWTLSSFEGRPSNYTVISGYGSTEVVFDGSGISNGRIRFEDAHYVKLENVTITDTNHGLYVLGQSSWLEFNNITVHDVGQEGIQIWDNSHHVTVDACTIYNTGRSVAQWGEGVYVGSGTPVSGDHTHDVTVRNCTIYNTTAESIELKPRTYYGVVENNLIYDSASGGSTIGAIEVGQTCFGSDCSPYEPSHIIRNNIVHDINGAGIFINTSALIYNNVLYDISGYGIYLADSSSDGFLRTVYHNTVDMNSNGFYEAGGNNDIQNNIGLENDGDCGGTDCNRATDPLYFVSVVEGGEDYHLAAGSAPVGSGNDLTSTVPYDIDGTARTSFDLGAYAFAP